MRREMIRVTQAHVGSRLDILPKVMSCLECTPHEPTDRCCFALHWGRIGRDAGIASGAGFAWPSRLGFWRFQRLLRTVVILCEGPTFLADLGNGHLPSSDGGQARGRHREICDRLCWSRWVLRGLGARGSRCIDVPGSLRRRSTWWPGSGARRTTYSRWWVLNVAATAGRDRWGTASSQRQIASISRSRHTSFHRSRTSGQLRVCDGCCVPGFRRTSSPALLGVPQGVRDTSRLGRRADRSRNRAPGSLGPRPGPWRGPSPGPAIDSPGAGDCFGVGATTSGTISSSRLVLPVGTGLFPGESTSIAVSESNLRVRTGRRRRPWGACWIPALCSKAGSVCRAGPRLGGILIFVSPSK